MPDHNAGAVGPRRLGLLPVDHSRPAVKLAPHLTGKVPVHPAHVDYASRVGDWGMLGNDQFGDCGPCGVAHQRLQVTAYLTGTPAVPTLDQTLALYKLCNPDFDPNTGAGDNGVVLQDMLSIVQKQGFAGTKALAFAKVDHTNLDEIRAALDLFGSVLFGVDLQAAQQQQTDNGGPWDYQPSSPWGGHCVLGVSYTSATSGTDIGVVTWGEVIGVTDAFLRNQLSEAWVCIFPEHLGTVEFQQGVDLASLAADYEALTGRPFPVSPNPQPIPGPSPQPVPSPDRVFAAAARAWLNAGHHSGRPARQLVGDLKAWLAATGN